MLTILLKALTVGLHGIQPEEFPKPWEEKQLTSQKCSCESRYGVCKEQRWGSSFQAHYDEEHREDKRGPNKREMQSLRSRKA